MADKDGPEEIAVAGCDFTRKATAVAQSAGTVKEQINQLPLEVIKALKWKVIFSYVKLEDTPRIRKKSSHT